MIILLQKLSRMTQNYFQISIKPLQDLKHSWFGNTQVQMGRLRFLSPSKVVMRLTIWQRNKFLNFRMTLLQFFIDTEISLVTKGARRYDL